MFLFPGRGSISNYMLKYLESCLYINIEVLCLQTISKGPMVGHSNHASFANISNCILVLSDSQFGSMILTGCFWTLGVWSMDEYGWLMFVDVFWAPVKGHTLSRYLRCDMILVDCITRVPSLRTNISAYKCLIATCLRSMPRDSIPTYMAYAAEYVPPVPRSQYLHYAAENHLSPSQLKGKWLARLQLH